MVIFFGAFVLWQVGSLVTVKDATPPPSVITVPADAAVVGEPRIDRQNFRVTTYMTIRSVEGRTAEELLDQMGLSEQPTQIGPTPLDWRPLWVYARATEGAVELRLVFIQDIPAGPVP